MDNRTVTRPPSGRNNAFLETTLLEAVLDELRAVRAELRAHRRLCDEFAATYLRSKFPYGKAVDRWRNRG